jgi:hypothetical protein
MQTSFLRFADEATAQVALGTVGIYVPSSDDVPGCYRQADINWAFDPIGTIIRGGEWDPETGEELEPPVVLDGWHANYIGPLPGSLEEFLVFPEAPVRKFAGID